LDEAREGGTVQAQRRHAIATERLPPEVAEHAQAGLRAMCVNLSRRINEQI
jgi:hypothetical protein